MSLSKLGLPLVMPPHATQTRIDVFAVRQWPGNGADLDFRGVLSGCTAAIVSAAPIEGTLTVALGDSGMTDPRAKEAFLATPNYAAAAKVLPPCRLWCVVEMAATLAVGKPLIFSCGKVEVAKMKGHGEGGAGVAGDEGGSGSVDTRVEVTRGDGAFNMLLNCAHLVDVEAAQCAVEADRDRELAAIGAANFALFNRTVAGALQAGAAAVNANTAVVDSFACGEPGPLRALPKERVPSAFTAACTAGQLAVLMELRDAHAEAVAAYLAGKGEGGKGAWQPVWTASMNGRNKGTLVKVYHQ